MGAGEGFRLGQRCACVSGFRGCAALTEAEAADSRSRAAFLHWVGLWVGAKLFFVGFWVGERWEA